MLGLTFVQIARSRGTGESRARATQKASAAYRFICESMCLVRMDDHELSRLGPMLENLKAGLDDLRSSA